ncbi:reticulon-like protein B12 [Phalaenopsis equestris]|uniref:reticulon-like protein B12 n=1 Tax=Phalaenopsis equestris TaxID=78828 RepID=UPI0009E3C245|nr:reticulon-like protein B12 [Phalaenopsis equestris]
MGSRRRRSVHELLGGGLLADVILWRRRHITIGILLGTFAAWVIFELSGYTLLSLVSRVLLLLVTILFVWAKAAGVLNRPPPPLPELHITEEATNLAADFFRTKINSILSASRDIALGRDPNLFCKVVACLWLISVVSSWTDFLTLSYSGLAVILTIPVLYEKYEDIIDKYLLLAYTKLKIIYEKLDGDCSGKVKKWILENGKLS